jgi:hypothetical protein
MLFRFYHAPFLFVFLETKGSKRTTINLTYNSVINLEGYKLFCIFFKAYNGAEELVEERKQNCWIG